MPSCSSTDGHGDKTRNFLLLDESAAAGVCGPDGPDGWRLPHHKTADDGGARPARSRTANELSVRFESPDLGGVKLVKTWTSSAARTTLPCKHEVVNTGSAAVSPQLYLQLVRDGNKPPGESSFYSTFTGPAVYTDAKKYQKVEFKDIEARQGRSERTASNGYVAMVQHYFATAWLLPDGMQRELFMRKVDGANLYSVGMITPWAIAPGASKTVDAQACSPARRSRP
jgi:YidC/Oxa1 family membrane protein insertase